MDFVGLNNLVLRAKSGFSPIVARVSFPKITQDGDWLCLVQIVGLEKSGKFRVYGADSFQAMQLGMRTLLDIIHTSPEQMRGEILIKDMMGGTEILDLDSLR